MALFGRAQIFGTPPSGAAFDPINDVGWEHAYWVEGPEFIATGPSDTVGQQTFPDEVGTTDLTQSTSSARPVYRTTGPSSGFKCLTFDGSNDGYPATSFTSIGLTHSVVIICFQSSGASDRYVIDGFDSTHRRIVGFQASGSTYRHYAGASATGGTMSSSNHAYRSKIVSGTSDLLTVDGSSVTTASAGDQTMTGITIGSAYDRAGAFFVGELMFVGIYAGDVTADGGWAGLVSWASSKYGVTLS